MKDFFKRHYEAAFIRLVIRILSGRNVPRSQVVSRRDNNDMYYMSEKLESIEKRIRTGYKHV
ncbi:TPA: hypothetical protein ACGVAU_004401 [Vibrio vulnificus]